MGSLFCWYSWFLIFSRWVSYLFESVPEVESASLLPFDDPVSLKEITRSSPAFVVLGFSFGSIVMLRFKGLSTGPD